VRVAILGAGGTIAPAIVRDLGESGEAASLLLLDIDARKAAQVAAAHGCGKADYREVDARDASLAEALHDCEVLVNSASYRINLDAMEACLEAGCHYLDLGGLYWMTGRQLELDGRFREAGLLGLLRMGSSPGKTNVMAARAVRELGSQASAIHVYAAGRDRAPQVPGGVLSVPYALQTLVDELTLSPIIVRDGEPVEIEPLTAGGEVDYTDSIGTADTIYTLHSELRTFPDSFGCRDASFRLSLAPALLERLRGLAGSSEREVEAAADRTAPPSPETVSVHRVDAAGDGETVSVFAFTGPMREWGLGGGVVSTAAPAAAAVRLLARGRIEMRGVLPPERCVDPDDLFPELERRACEFVVDRPPGRARTAGMPARSPLGETGGFRGSFST
jgi:lysine 6-dehydrogenase